MPNGAFQASLGEELVSLSMCNFFPFFWGVCWYLNIA